MTFKSSLNVMIIALGHAQAVELPPLSLGILLTSTEPVLAVTWGRGHEGCYHYNVQFFVGRIWVFFAKKLKACKEVYCI